MNAEPVDTGAALRAQFAAEGGVTAAFSPKVADYVAARPDYPAALFDALRERGLMFEGVRVADIGAGTGLLTRQLLDRGARVTAIEPNDAMRAACDAALQGRAAYASVAGTAEATGLPAGSVDLVTAAQAFHWFEADAARREFLRILTPTGQVALIWNDRHKPDPLHDAMDQVFATYGGAKLGAMLAHEDRADVPRFFAGAPMTQLEWPHEHRLDAAGLQALAFSRSYMPLRDSEAGQRAAQDLQRLFDTFAVDGRVTVRYRTFVIFGRPQA